MDETLQGRDHPPGPARARRRQRRTRRSRRTASTPPRCARCTRCCDDWFPGAAPTAPGAALEGRAADAARRPAGAGRERRAGVWLNLGHGSSGWALACGSARGAGRRDRRPRGAAGHRAASTPQRLRLSAGAAAAASARGATISAWPPLRHRPHRAARRALAAARRGGLARRRGTRRWRCTPPHALMAARRPGRGAAGAGAGAACAARLVAAGPGNNGGDGLVAARHLHAGRQATSASACSATPARLPADAAQALATRAGSRRAPSARRARRRRGADLVIDALLGLGARRAPEGAIAAAIAAINARPAPVLAVDLPSGLHADTGAAARRRGGARRRTRWRC